MSLGLETRHYSTCAPVAIASWTLKMVQVQDPSPRFDHVERESWLDCEEAQKGSERHTGYNVLSTAMLSEKESLRYPKKETQ